jgi:phage-related minor tail protein
MTNLTKPIILGAAAVGVSLIYVLAANGGYKAYHDKVGYPEGTEAAAAATTEEAAQFATEEPAEAVAEAATEEAVQAATEAAAEEAMKAEEEAKAAEEAKKAEEEAKAAEEAKKAEEEKEEASEPEYIGYESALIRAENYTGMYPVDGVYDTYIESYPTEDEPYYVVKFIYADSSSVVTTVYVNAYTGDCWIN